jgi:hypothetical protein
VFDLLGVEETDMTKIAHITDKYLLLNKGFVQQEYSGGLLVDQWGRAIGSESISSLSAKFHVTNKVLPSMERLKMQIWQCQ